MARFHPLDFFTLFLAVDQLVTTRQSTGKGAFDEMVCDHPHQGKEQDCQGCHSIGASSTSQDVQLFGVQR
jgi:hypothetical protein